MSAPATDALLHARRQDPLRRGLRRRLAHGFYRLSFRSKLVLISTAVSLICLLLAGVVLATNEVLLFRQAMLSRAIALADVTAANSEASLSFEDRESAAQLLANLRPEASIEEARIVLRHDDGLEAFAGFSRREQPLPPLPLSLEPGHRFAADHLEVVRPILQEQQPIGYVQLRVGLGQLEATLWRFVQTIGALGLLTVLVAWLLSHRLQRVITRPVTELVSTADAISRGRDYSVRARVLADDELGMLTRAFNAMLVEVQAHDAARQQVEAEMRRLNEGLEAKVQARTAELQARNAELNTAIETLRRAQSQLVESEKMAALGGLVAGVAHEINTPLGMCVTMVSHLGDQIGALQGAYEHGIRRSQFEEFLAGSRQSVEIVQGNLARAAELVRSFKLVAVDQSSEACRRFVVADYLDDVLLSLRPQLKLSQVAVELDCDPGLEIDSYPGVLAQVITNLTVNALVHAYRPDEPGTIRIACRIEAGDFVLEFADDGAGMPESVRLHMFEPFFTTRRGDGGSGLGLHIVYNQVTQTLGGRIGCDSKPGQGSRFTVRFPLRSGSGG
jgi:signal transduction histidine kinase